MTRRMSKTFQTVLFLAVMALVACGSAFAGGPPDEWYAKYNIHAQDNGKEIKASYAGYIDSGSGHLVVPAGTKVEITKKGGFFRKTFTFTYAGKSIIFEYDAGKMGLSMDEYMDLILSKTPVVLKGLSATDMKGVKEGRALTGMTKQGVMTALGYPAKHKTPSLEDSTWTYWRNRFATMVVEFDGTGRVKSIR